MLSLAEAVYEQGRLDEAEQLAAAAEELRQEELPSVRAKVLASGGELVEAEALALRSVELARRRARPGSVSLPRRKPTRPTWRNARRLGCYARPALWSWA
jgi:hypothetical protein